jgi:protein-disulfide isomerase
VATAHVEARVSATAVVAAPPPAPSEDSAKVPVATADPTWGSRDALVTVVLFGDLECPFTGRILKTVQALEQKYGPADLRVVWKDEPLPFHAHARPAAEAAEAVFTLGKADAFWRFWEQALAHQTDLTAASFEAWAALAGVDVESFRRLVASHAAAAKVDADLALAQRLHADGTPTFFINGTVVVGAQPLDRFDALVASELEAARARVSSGVSREVVYADRAGTNWKEPVAEPPPEEEKEDTTTVWAVPVGASPVLGKASALVTIVEFSDFQCPYCKAAEATMKEIARAYGDKVRLVWKDEPLPFHPRALPAAEVAREARAEKGDAGFWAAHDAIFKAAPDLEDDDLLKLAAGLGLDKGRVASAIHARRFAAQIQTDEDAAEDVHADGTPHFFINGRRLAGAQPFEAFKSIIDEEIRHGEDLVAHGTAPAALYAAMMKAAATPPPGEARHVAARANAPFKGPAGAPVVIEEFADFQCPFCTRAEATMAKISAEYGARVKFVWRNLPLPFHDHARDAAEAALEAQHQKGNLGFWAMHDKLFAHQGDNGGDGSGLSRAALDGYAREIGLDVAAFDRALDGEAHKAEIEDDVRAADAAQINGTPAFVVGGYLVSGAQPFGAFRRVIDQVLAKGPAR